MHHYFGTKTQLFAAAIHIPIDPMTVIGPLREVPVERIGYVLDIRMYLDFRRAPVVLGDMYEIVRGIEVRLHRFTKAVFVREFGEEDWWRNGVPDNIRAECAALREKDPDPAPEPYNYTHLIALREILDRKWAIVSPYLPSDLAQNKKELLERLLQLNRIRNNVMHPVRGGQLAEEEFEFVFNLDADLGPLGLPEAHAAEKQDKPLTVPGQEQPSAETNVPVVPELVSKLSPLDPVKPAQEFATTEQEASGEEFIPSIRIA